MIRFLLRFVGLLLLALGFIFLVYDGIRSISDGSILLTKDERGLECRPRPQPGGVSDPGRTPRRPRHLAGRHRADPRAARLGGGLHPGRHPDRAGTQEEAADRLRPGLNPGLLKCVAVVLMLGGGAAGQWPSSTRRPRQRPRGCRRRFAHPNLHVDDVGGLRRDGDRLPVAVGVHRQGRGEAVAFRDRRDAAAVDAAADRAGDAVGRSRSIGRKSGRCARRRCWSARTCSCRWRSGSPAQGRCWPGHRCKWRGSAASHGCRWSGRCCRRRSRCRPSPRTDAPWRRCGAGPHRRPAT